jgi:hypothetical protein
MQKLATGALLLLVASNATAGLQVYLTPQDWVRSTDSHEEISSYISDVSTGKFSNQDAYSPDALKGLNTYAETLKNTISPLFSAQDYKAYDNTFCKLSITTGNTSDKDTSPPEVLMLDGFADNNSKGCYELTQKIEKSVNTSSPLRYPAPVKDAGLLSIDLIVHFSK